MTGRRWLVLGLVVVIAAVAVVLVVIRDDGDDGDSATTTTTTAAPTGRAADLAAAVKRANVHIEGVTDADVETTITAVCDAADANTLASQVVALGITSQNDIRAFVEGAGHGAEQLCPDVAAAQPALLNDVYNAVLAQLASSTTATTAAS